MGKINNIGQIHSGNPNLPQINIGNGGVRYIQNLGTTTPLIGDNSIREINGRGWIGEPPQAIPVVVPVTTTIGTPIVNIPGCVKVHKENKFPGNGSGKNKQNLDNDPKGSMTLCDAGAPYYDPPDYQANELTWMTVYGEQEEEPSGVKTNEADTKDLGTPEPPKTPPTSSGTPDCPPANAQRIGDVSQSKKERVKGYELNKEKTECITLWEPIPVVDRYLPSPSVITTTAGIAAVATTSALLAKPLADLLLKVVKPVIKKVLTKVKTMLGQTPHRPNRSEIQANQYREKKGMLPLNFGKKKKELKKGK